MSWQTHKEQVFSPKQPSNFPAMAEKAKSEVKELQSAVAALRAQYSREKNTKLVHDQFTLLNKQAADCSKTIRLLGQTQAYTADERQARSRAISSLTGQLQEELRKVETLAFELASEDRIDIAEVERPKDEPEEEEKDEAQAFEEALLRDRRDELAGVEASMDGIKAMIADAGKLVQNQGEMLDRIDLNMGEAVANTGKATEELHKTEKSQKTKRALLCILIFGLMIVIVVIIVMVTQTS